MKATSETRHGVESPSFEDPVNSEKSSRNSQRKMTAQSQSSSNSTPTIIDEEASAATTPDVGSIRYISDDRRDSEKSRRNIYGKTVSVFATILDQCVSTSERKRKPSNYRDHG